MKRKTPKYYAEEDLFCTGTFAVFRQYRWKRKAIWVFDNMVDAKKLAENLERAQ